MASSALLRNFWIIVLGIVFILCYSVIPCEGGSGSSRKKRQDGEIEEPEEGAPPGAVSEPGAADSSPSAPDGEVTIVASDEWIENSLKKINELRWKHGTCPLTLDKNLCKTSQKRANEMVDTAQAVDIAVIEGDGEAIYATAQPNESDSIPAPDEAINHWYDQKSKYDFTVGRSRTPEDDTYGFSQILWKASTSVCITYARGPKNVGDETTVVVVAIFSPVGNVEGQYLANVQPAEEGTTGPEKHPSKIKNDKCPTKEARASKAWLDNVLVSHNKLRKLHKSPPLILNEDLSRISQDWADKMAKSNEFEHNSDCLRSAELGENLYFSSNSNPSDEPANGTRAVIAWYEEIENYDYQTTESHNGQEILHFTQLVWKGTKEIGGAYAISKKPNKYNLYSTYVVVNYSPRGNYGDFHKNVLKPICNNIQIEGLNLPHSLPPGDKPLPDGSSPSRAKSIGVGTTILIYSLFASFFHIL